MGLAAFLVEGIVVHICIACGGSFALCLEKGLCMITRDEARRSGLVAFQRTLEA
jgi:hypothetical protein